jgi:ComF family protein
MRALISYLRHFLELVYPNQCHACNGNLVQGEELLSTSCLYELPRTNFHKTPEINAVAELFYGITTVKYATAFYIFEKGSKFRHLIHNLKYKNAPQIGFVMGKYFGSELQDSVFKDIDLIVPVPLHPKKLKTRGYNQSERIGAGLSESTTIPQDTQTLVRKIFTETQTKKNLEERRKNVESVFDISNPLRFRGKHILLIDDVVTTGSTLVACADEILKIEGTTVSIACLAIAKH